MPLLSRYAGRTAALAILVALLLLTWAVIVNPLWSAWSDRADQADRLTDLIVRLKRTAAQAPALRAQLAQTGRNEQEKTAVFVAASPVLAAAALQAEIRRIADADGAQLRSIQQLPSVSQEALNRIGVRAELQSDTPQMAHFLYDLEAHTPILVVRSLSVRGTEQPNFVPGQRPPLYVQIEIAAFAGAAE